MKLIVITLLIFLSFLNSSFGGRAVVTVLEAPLFRHPSKKSTIVQYVRKGTIVYIHNQHMDKIPHLEDYKLESKNIDDIETDLTPVDAQEVDSLLNDDDSLYTINDYEYKDRINFNEDKKLKFYKTLDRIKRDAYIPAHYVKLLYNDKRELTDTYKLPFDPTDYRLSEPLPKRYPLYYPDKYISDIALTFGPNNTIYYPYESDVKSNRTTVRSGFKWSYLTNSRIDNNHRLFFGGMFDLHLQENNLQLENRNYTKELFIDFGIGPQISYYVYKGSKYSTIISGAMGLNYGRAYIKQTPEVGIGEERMYKGISLSSNLGITFNRTNVIPDILDIFLGVEVQLVFRHRKTSGTKINNGALWNNKKDEVYYPTHSNISIITGIRIFRF